MTECHVPAEQSKTCLIFNSEGDCDIAADIFNNRCIDCPSNETCFMWCIPEQRPDGKWWIFKNINKISSLPGGLTYTEEQYSDDMESQNE